MLDAAGDRPVTFRTLDIGGDKVLPYMKRPEEENPALGWRAIRIGLDRPALLRTQLRAMLRAGAGRTAHHVADGRRASTNSSPPRALLERELAFCDVTAASRPRRSEGRRDGRSARRCCGSSTKSAERADFLSVGSNDLLQYLFAADRDNKRVSDRFDTLSAGFLRALKAIADAGRAP